MPSIYWRKPRTTAPNAVVPFDLNCALNDGLAGVFAPGLFQGNLVTHRPFFSVAGTTRTILRGQGEAWSIASGGLRDYPIQALGNTATLAALFQTTSGSSETVLSVGAGNNSDNWLELSFGANLPPFARARTGGTAGTATATNSTRFRRAALIGSFKSSTSRSIISVSQQNQDESTLTQPVEIAADTASASVAGNDTIVIGGLYRGGSITQQSTATTVALAVVTRIPWTDDQAVRWARNPWQLWAPDERRVWIIPSGGTFNPAWARNTNIVIQGTV